MEKHINEVEVIRYDLVELVVGMKLLHIEKTEHIPTHLL
jgi:hypothetical protein